MDTLFNGIYKGRNVLVTGHTGFKGSWLSLWLSKMGAKVVGYSVDVPTDPSHFGLQGLAITSVTGDVLDRKKLLATIERHRPDIVFHLAAQPLVRRSYKEPVLTFETNAIGSMNVLESCRSAKTVKAIVYATSDKCYRNTETARAYREDDALGGDDPYSASKACAELISNAYRKSFFATDEYGKSHSTLLADTRAGNVIGGGDWSEDRLIPDIVRAASKDEAVVIRNPAATRPWQHVLEPLSGYLHLGWKLLEGEKECSDNWNFGPAADSPVSVREAVERAQKTWGKIRYEIREDRDEPHEATLLQIDSSKARLRLGWKNVWNSDTALEKTIEWYREYYQSKALLSERNLEEYLRDAKRIAVEWAR
jgi:CDP-glucose 4,6-dehydratase